MSPDFNEWLKQFKAALIESGLPARQEERYETEFRDDAMSYYRRGASVSDAVVGELLP